MSSLVFNVLSFDLVDNRQPTTALHTHLYYNLYVIVMISLGHLLTFPFPQKKFIFQTEGAGHKNRASCLQDLFSQWVIPTEAWPILNEMALGQQIPAGLHCIIQLFWTHALAVSELAAAIELLLPPICTQLIEWLLQPCPHCLLNILPWANGAHRPGHWACSTWDQLKGLMSCWGFVMMDHSVKYNV